MDKYIYLDFDGTTVNSKKRFSVIFNECYCNYEEEYLNWKEINTWNAGIKDSSIVEEIFCHPHFHDEQLEIFDSCLDALKNAREKYGFKIILYTKGRLKNIQHKAEFVNNYLSDYIDGWKFEGTEDVSMGKYVKTNNGDITIMIDDHITNLQNNGCLYNICAKLCGDKEEWNKDWNGKTITNWNQLDNILYNIVHY